MVHPVRLFESDLHTAEVHGLPASAAMAQSSVEKARSESEAKLLLAEVQHRMHNTLAVMRSLVRLTADTSKTVEHYAMHLEGRIGALARVQTAATRDPAGWVDLEMLVAEELHAYRAQEGEQVDRIHGPAIRLQSKAAEIFALAIHELATNAVKYGALSTPQGHVRISWRVNKGRGEPHLLFEWKEGGVPGRLARKRRGFGTAWLERTLPRELGAAAKQECDPRGLRWVIELPLTERITMRKPARHRVKNENDLSQRVAISARGPHRDALSGMRCVLP
ncbi:sensor histidine kinase [Microvirga sp. P5_D2]